MGTFIYILQFKETGPHIKIFTLGMWDWASHCLWVWWKIAELNTLDICGHCEPSLQIPTQVFSQLTYCRAGAVYRETCVFKLWQIRVLLRSPPPSSLPPSSCQNGPGQFCQLNSEYSKENGRMHPCTGCNPSLLFQLLPNSQMNWHCEFKRLVSIGDSQKPPRQPEQYWSL